MRAPTLAGAAAAVALLFLAPGCGSQRAADQLAGGVLFYPWTHGANLDSEQVAAIREERVRDLEEIEDFAGTLEDWRARTEPVESLHISPADFVYGSHFFVYYLAVLDEPAVSPRLEVRIQRTDPSGEKVWDHLEFIDSRKNRRVHPGGLLFSMHGLAAGTHRLRFEFVDGGRLGAAGELEVDFDPGPPGPE